MSYRSMWCSKRAFLFTTLAVLVVVGIIIYMSAQDRMYPRTLAQMNRVHTMDSYLANLEEDMPRAAYIACFRSLIGLEEYISTTGEYVADFDSAFTGLFTNGTINSSSVGIMNQSSFNDFAQRFQALAIRQGINANLTVLSVDASQSDPWHVTLTAYVQIYLTDRATSVSFNRTVPVVSVVPISDIKDPVHSVGTQGRAPHVVKQANFSAPYIDASNDTTLLQLLVNETYYVASPLAPSFLQRFEGNFTADPNGIVSLVNIQELTAQDFTITQCKSVVDFIYFGAPDSDPNYYVVNMDSTKFWLNDGFLATFSANGKVVGTAPCP